MTCIVGVEDEHGATLAGDSCQVSNGRTVSGGEPKVFRLRQVAAEEGATQRVELLLGATGSRRGAQLLKYRLKVPYQPERMSDGEWMVTRLVDAMREVLSDGGWMKKENEREDAYNHTMVVHRGRLWKVQSDLQVSRTAHGYDATGSGENVALGSLHVQRGIGRTRAAQASRALYAAAEHDAYVAPPFTVLEQEREGGGSW